MDATNAFLEAQRRTNPEKYALIAEKYPTISFANRREIQKREITVGLLGSQVDARIPQSVAIENGFEFFNESAE